MESQIDLVVNLEQWKRAFAYDRRWGWTIRLFRFWVSSCPVDHSGAAGRNLAVIIEVAAMNNRHKKWDTMRRWN